MTTSRHGGNIRALASASGRAPEEIIDFSANITPLGPPEWLRSLVSRSVSDLVHYPDPAATELVNAVAASCGVSSDEVVAANSLPELSCLFPIVLEHEKAVVVCPSCVDCEKPAGLAGMRVSLFETDQDSGFMPDLERLGSMLNGNELVFIDRPDNLAGTVCDSDELRSLATGNPGATFLVDETFGGYVHEFDSLTRNRPANVVVLMSPPEVFAAPGITLGCAVADRTLIHLLKERLIPRSVNFLAQAVGKRAVADREYIGNTRAYIAQLRRELLNGLVGIGGLKIFDGLANFCLVKIDSGRLSAPELAGKLLKEYGIAVRTCDDCRGLDESFFRVFVRTERENALLVEALKTVLGRNGGNRRKVLKRTPAIMIQGTSSDAGKSILTAALCRIFLQDGFRPAPFKAQNMSNNSFVTKSGEEMGRAQVVQAQACRTEPDVRMNPVLLKPNSDAGAQVVLMGRAMAVMDVPGYTAYKEKVWKEVTGAFDSLTAEHDLVVMEGAGSPGEVNLKKQDIVNMKMARYARAPVLLVGDIDRGGVFASFIGTMEVLAEWERDLVAGFVVNKFRGDRELLGDAFDYMHDFTGRPVLGTIDYIPDLGLPEEDAVCFQERTAVVSGDVDVDVVILDLPHVSNFTDLDALEMEPDVNVRPARRADEIGTPDAIILPGTRNVIGDLEEMKKRGIDTRIMELAESGSTEIVGLCGGYQMLGERISDPDGIESTSTDCSGLGLLPLTTIMSRDKTLKRTQARHLESGLPVYGYEIHHGRTPAGNSLKILVGDDGETAGTGSADGMIWGTYIHGVFDSDSFRGWYVDRLRKRRGLGAYAGRRAVYDLEPAFERLADIVRNSLDMDAVYRAFL